ncbi:ribosomal protein S18, partial [Eremomyces bilateralis CBS 781.70]
QERAKEAQHARRLESQIARIWQPGDVYAPRDMGKSEQMKWSTTIKRMRNGTAGRERRDVFDTLGINPLNEYKNFSLLAEFTSSMGRIYNSSQTGLRKRNQRKIAKAIRRAIGIGLIPSVHHHPELVLRDPNWRP